MDLCPWADLVYGCDAPWWRHRRGLPEFDGLKVCWAGNGLDGFPDVHRVEIARERGGYREDLVMQPQGTIGGGGNSGFQALNLALQFGARDILLIGFDMSDQGGVHWYGRNRWPMANNPDRSSFRRWIAAYGRALPTLMALGARVFNGSPHSALDCFPRVTIDGFMEHLDRV